MNKYTFITMHSETVIHAQDLVQALSMLPDFQTDIRAVTDIKIEPRKLLPS